MACRGPELARAYLPRPLTIVVPKQAIIPDEVTAGLASAGINHVAPSRSAELPRLAALPIAAPARIDLPSFPPRRRSMCATRLATNLDFYWTAGSVKWAGVHCGGGDSGWVGGSASGYGVGAGRDRCYRIVEGAHRSPGQDKKHYSPRTRVLPVAHGKLPEHGRGAYRWIEYEAIAVRTIRMPAQPEAYAAELYSRLHELDSQGYAWTAVELPLQTREWAAVRDRLTCAAY